MKKFFILFAVVFTMLAVNSSFSLPNFWYSAVAYNTSGQIITNGTIEVNITIFDGTTTFTENYLTTSALSTDAFGIFNVQIGTGSNSGNLSSVLMKSNTTITVKVRPVATFSWVTITGTQLSTIYFNSYVNANVLVPALPNGQIFVGNSSNVATPRTMSGDATLNNTGVLNINPGVIVNADINTAAAIDVTKLAAGTNGYFLVTYNGNTNAWTDPYSLTVLRAVNLKNGIAGDIPYQTGANTTTFLGIGTPNKIMTSTGIAPQWVSSLTDSQLDDNLTINGGTVNNSIIGGTTPAAGTFTNLTVNGTSELKGNIFNSTGDIVINDNLTVNFNTSINGNINLGDAISDMIYYVGKVNSNILPAVDNGFDLGSSVFRWKDFYSSGTINGSNLYMTGNLNVDGNTRLGNAAGDNIDFQGTISNTLDRVTINDGINQTGAGQVTFSGNVDANNGLDVNGTSTFAGVITQTGAGNQVTFSGNIDATNGLDVTGNNLTVTNNDAIIGTAGIFTNSSAVSDLYVQGNIESDGNQFFGDNSSDFALFAGDIDLTGFIYTTGASAVKVGDDMIVYQNFTQNSTTGTNFFNANTNFNADVTLGNANTDNVVFTADVNSNIIPNIDAAFDLGTSSQKWRDINYSGTLTGSNGNFLNNLTVYNNSTLGDLLTDLIYLNGTISNNLPGTPITLADGINQTGASQVTFSGNVDALNGIDITNTSTFAGVITQTGAGNQVTFSGNVDATNGLDVTGNNFTVDGVFSITQLGVISQSANQQVTFSGNVDATNGLDVSGNNLTVATNALLNGNITLGDANIDNVVFIADVNSNILPNTDNTYDLGSASQSWKDIYYDGTVYGVNLNLSGNLNIDGNTRLGNASGDNIDLQGTIFNSLSSITIADGVNQTGASQVTFSGNVDALNGLDVTNTSTFAGVITQTGAGNQVTFSGNVDATNGLDVSGNNLTVATNALLNGNINLGDANTDNIIFLADVDSNILPNLDNTYDLGSNLQSWRNIYFDGLLTGGSATVNNVIIPTGGLSVQAGGVSVNSGNLFVNNNIDIRGQIFNAGSGSVGVVINDYVELWNTISNPTAQNGGRVYVGDDFQVTGSTDLNGSITNTSGTNGGKVWIADDFQVAGSTYLASVSINGALNDGVSNGNNGQVPIADGTGNWSWSDMAGSFAIKTDGKTISGDGTITNPIRVNSLIISDANATFDCNSIANVYNYTGNGAPLSVTNPTTGRIIYVMHTAGSGNLTFAGKNIGVNQAMSFIYTGTQWIVISSN